MDECGAGDVVMNQTKPNPTRNRNINANESLHKIYNKFGIIF
jgi:hypothetical protein